VLARLGDEVELLSRLVADLRLLSLADAGGLELHKQRRDLGQLCQETVAAFDHVAQARQQRLVYQGSSLWATLDPERLRQVLYNLIDNALRHTPEAGSVACTLSLDAGWARLEVSDTGPGIPSEDVERIFLRLYRADAVRNRNQGGSGLGLAIVRTLVELHGGTVWAENRPNGGAVFTVRLPTG
jgi:two-component system, OmpR family, sensor histidine kinase BaeS